MTTQNLDESGSTDDIELRDDGPEKKSGSPFRMCLATREKRPASQMIRFVLSPDGEVFPDIASRLPGRGVWVSSDREKLEGLVQSKGGFARGFKAQVKVSETLTDQVEEQLLQRCQATLGLAKRSGVLILGFDQVRNELQRKSPGWLIEASDGSEDGRRRLIGLAIGLYEKVRVASALSSEELGMALGRDNVIHGLLKTGQFADVWTRDYRRLYEFRQVSGDVWYSGAVE
ncbi:RNA-binding protein [Ponticaulis sp.]|uniref:RNA-binding protein n=1 Tax=Ponticaulis sp. TaxID=2020902 RepID=UPI000B707F22|nr:RNA-binding protein [Ponticaulis sp.]MAI91132.1 hypothetical protein [Ponticaulis sp.]OUX98449.1 MAG: hypothetical protein CBB65_11845 [Hyphomonadaceae bacterium TMED5]|tara:strand:- start:5164 stop:5853 length:690 start_codon:yes stop_codon:yes gene_type:complete